MTGVASLLTPAADSLAPARSALTGLRLRRIPIAAFPSSNSLLVERRALHARCARPDEGRNLRAWRVCRAASRFRAVSVLQTFRGFGGKLPGPALVGLAPAQAVKLRAFSPNSSSPAIGSNHWAEARENIRVLGDNVIFSKPFLWKMFHVQFLRREPQMDNRHNFTEPQHADACGSRSMGSSEKTRKLRI